MSRLRDRRARRDSYYRKARDEGFASRAVYKLKELDRRFHVLRPGQRVLDFGCWPGSWLQYAAGRVGPGGRVVGLDLKEVSARLPRWAEALVADIYQVTAGELLGSLGGPADVVLSDAAPHTTGIRLTDAARSAELVGRVLTLAVEVLRPGGMFVAKAFQGDGFDELLLHIKESLGKTRCVRPKGSRPGSMEIYVVATRRKETD